MINIYIFKMLFKITIYSEWVYILKYNMTSNVILVSDKSWNYGIDTMEYRTTSYMLIVVPHELLIIIFFLEVPVWKNFGALAGRLVSVQRPNRHKTGWPATRNFSTRVRQKCYSKSRFSNRLYCYIDYVVIRNNRELWLYFHIINIFIHANQRCRHVLAT